MTLALGVALSLFTACVVTRYIVYAVYAVGVRNPKYWARTKKEPAFDFIGRRKLTYGIAAIVIAAGLVAMIFNAANGRRALNFSLEFLGGTSTTVGFNEDYSLVELDDSGLLALAREAGVQPLMHLSTLTENGNFSTERATQVLNDPALSARLISEAAAKAAQKGYRGLDLDFEFLGAANAAAYAGFAARLREALDGLPLITALAPKTSDTQPGLLYEGHDYGALGAASDAVLLMTYEWGYTYGPPMAVAPLPNVRRVVEYALSRIPAEKIFLGFPNYGYDWPLPYARGTTRARSISNPEAVWLAAEFGAEIRFDDGAQTPYFNYTAGGTAHEVWFEDPRSAKAKYDLVSEYALRGVGFWNFMRPFPAGFALLGAMFEL